MRRGSAYFQSAGGEEILRRLFEPLGYELDAVQHPLDERFPGALLCAAGSSESTMPGRTRIPRFRPSECYVRPRLLSQGWRAIAPVRILGSSYKFFASMSSRKKHSALRKESVVKMPRLLPLLLALLLLCAPAAGGVTGSSLRVSGTVSSISPGTVTIAADSGQTLSFRLVAATTYARDGQATDFSALAVGESVRVKYHLEASGSLKAKEVDVETTTGVASAPVWVRGSVISVTPDVLMVKNDASGQEVTVRLSPTTGYEKNRQPAAVGDLRPGQTASTAVLQNGHKARVGALAVADRVHVVGTVVANVFAAHRIVAARAVRKP